MVKQNKSEKIAKIRKEEKEMINHYREIVDSQAENIFDPLARMGLDVIFDPLIEFYEGDALLTKAVKFIVYCFSIDSDRISVGGDRRKEKASIFKFLGMEDEFYNDFVLLQNEGVVKSVQKWLRQQENALFEYLMTLKEAYVQQQAASLRPLQKGKEGEIDWDQKQKCIEHMAELRKMIKDAEQELMQNDPKMKDIVEDVKKAAKKFSTLGPENYAI